MRQGDARQGPSTTVDVNHLRNRLVQDPRHNIWLLIIPMHRYIRFPVKETDDGSSTGRLRVDRNLAVKSDKRLGVYLIEPTALRLFVWCI